AGSGGAGRARRAGISADRGGLKRRVRRLWLDGDGWITPLRRVLGHSRVGGGQPGVQRPALSAGDGSGRADRGGDPHGGGAVRIAPPGLAGPLGPPPVGGGPAPRGGRLSPP